MRNYSASITCVSFVLFGGLGLFFLFGRNLNLVAMREVQNTISLNTEKQVAGLSLNTVMNGDFLNVQRIFYNRVTKCASRTTLTLFETLSKSNNWNFPPEDPLMRQYSRSSKLYWTNKETLIMGYVNLTRHTRPPYLVQGHIHFIDYSRYKEDPPPHYINLVREPLSRLVSNFYFNHRWGIKKGYKYTLNYDQCVKQKVPECVEPSPGGYFTLIPWFCGHDPICRYPNQAAIQRAKANIETSYGVIGLNEHYDKFLEMLERTYPQFFRNASATFRRMSNKDQHRWYNTNRIEPNNKTVEVMSKLLTEETEFYQYIKQRFFSYMQHLRH